MTLSVEDLASVVAAGECDRTEIRSLVPYPKTVAKNISALANTYGGHVVLGAAGTSTGLKLSGIDAVKGSRVVQQGISTLSPSPQLVVDSLEVGGRKAIVITVEPALDAPILAGGIAYVREGACNVTATASQLLSRVSTNSSPAQSRETLEQFSRAIEEQGILIQKLLKDSRPRSKMIWAFIGAVIGTMLGLIPLVFIG